MRHVLFLNGFLLLRILSIIVNCSAFFNTEAAHIAQDIQLHDQEREKLCLAEQNTDDSTDTTTTTAAPSTSSSSAAAAPYAERKAITFPAPDVKKVYSDLQNKLSGVFGPEHGDVFTFSDDMYNFLTTSNDDNLGLSRSHVQLLGELLLNNEDVKQTARLDLLALL